MRVATGDNSRYLYYVAVDPTDLKTPETGLTSFTVAHSVAGGGDVAWTTPTTAQVDATAAPGLYALLLDEMPAITSGVDEQEVAIIISHASMRTVFRTVELYRPKVTAGETLAVASGITTADVNDKTGFEISGTLNTFDDLADHAETERWSAGRPAAEGLLQTGSTTTALILDPATLGLDDHYNGMFVELVDSTGLVDGTYIDDYVAATQTATPRRAVRTSVATTTTYKVYTADTVPAHVLTLATGAITAASIASDAITSGKIAADAIGASELAADAATEIATAIRQAAVTMAAAADGATPTVEQLMVMIGAKLGVFRLVRSGTTLTAYAADESTVLMTWTLDSATAPTSILRAS